MENKKIVIVEDETSIVEALNVRLLAEGFELISASNGKVGLELIREEKPALAILDLMMPEMDGYEVLAKLKASEETKSIPVIILSNVDDEDSKKRVFEDGAARFVIKTSIDLEDFVKTIHSYVD